MAHYQIYTERDATIYEKYPERNTGIDQILELVKTTSGSRLDDLFQVASFNTRILVDFNGTQFTELSKSISNGEMGSSVHTRKFYLNMKSVYASDLPISYSLHAYPVSESWNNGAGNYADLPETRNGVSWYYRDNDDNKTVWNTGSAHSANTSAGLTNAQGGGAWWTGSGYEASQQFNYISPDVRMEITPIVIKWMNGHIPNNGLIIKQKYEDEVNNAENFNLKFFSKDTHTIYAPKLEVVWPDISNAGTASLTETNVTASGGPIVYFKNIEESYPEGSRTQFRLGIRSQYPTKTYSTASHYTTNEILPPNSASYAVCDAVTGETLLDYDDTYTCISNDKQGSYFNYWMDALSPERYYKFKIRAKYDNNIIKYFDNGYYFKVVR
tara:strand:+ start:4770 stop:5921 length:1152 start_codon:yes stop_codon:yes gene_type:complete